VFLPSQLYKSLPKSANRTDEWMDEKHVLHTKKNLKGANVRIFLKGLSNKIIGLKYSRSERSKLSKETAYFRELHNAQSTVENFIITVRNQIVKGYKVAWNNMLHIII
jgi:hypothetical protein